MRCRAGVPPTMFLGERSFMLPLASTARRGRSELRGVVATCLRLPSLSQAASRMDPRTTRVNSSRDISPEWSTSMRLKKESTTLGFARPSSAIDCRSSCRLMRPLPSISHLLKSAVSVDQLAARPSASCEIKSWSGESLMFFITLAERCSAESDSIFSRLTKFSFFSSTTCGGLSPWMVLRRSWYAIVLTALFLLPCFIDSKTKSMSASICFSSMSPFLFNQVEGSISIA